MRSRGRPGIVVLGVALAAATSQASVRLPRSAQPKITARAVSAVPLRLTAFPRAVSLHGPTGSRQLLVTGVFGADELRDLTHRVRYLSLRPRIVAVSATGLVSAVGDGTTVVTAVLGRQSVRIPVTVIGSRREAPLDFVHDVEPILSRAGCNSGACHGKATGQNGFRLSLFGFDPAADYDAIVREGRGRRVFPARPGESLFLAKATAAVPHGGGRRLDRESAHARLLQRWIARGMRYEQPKRPRVTRLEVVPGARVMARGASQQLVVTARYSDGTARDVTHEALYRSNEESLAAIDAHGRVTVGQRPGEAALMAGYMGQVAVFRAVLPVGAPPAAFGPFPAQNFVDEHVGKKLRALGIPPSPLCTDGEFLRRLSLDLCGRLPTPEEVRAFLADRDPSKRRKRVDRLLEDPDTAAFFAQKWANLLRNTGQYPAGANAFYGWLREAFTANMPYDRLVRSIVAAQGEWQENPPAAWFWQFRDGGVHEIVGDVAQLFMGTRMQCARCHHHPYEKWGQDDYYGLVGFFSRMGQKVLTEPGYYYTARKVTLGETNPRTGKVPDPKYLAGAVLAVRAGEDPRQRLADWLAKPSNPFLAPALVNRVWAHFMGRGLVEPIDDMRVTNPPSNAELLTALSRDFVRHQFDLKHLIRTLVTSRTYQLSSVPNRYNAADRAHHARFYARRLRAEVLLDAVDRLTGTKTSFSGVPARARAIDLPHELFSSYFLDVFGRPRQLSSPCECARDSGANLSQVLHLANGGEIDEKLRADDGRAARLAAAKTPLPERIRELYLAAFARSPDADELRQAAAVVRAEKEPRRAFEDLIWSLLNCREFQFNH